MSRKCLEQLNNKDVLEQFDSKINNGMSEKIASLEILNEQINNFKDEYISFVKDFKDSTSDIAKFKVIEDNINSQIQEFLKPKEVATEDKSESIVQPETEYVFDNEDDAIAKIEGQKEDGTFGGKQLPTGTIIKIKDSYFTVKNEVNEDIDLIPLTETVKDLSQSLSLTQPLNNDVDIKYPPIINGLDTLKLMELSNISNDEIIPFKKGELYTTTIENLYGEYAGTYVDVTDSELSKSEGEFFKNNPIFSELFLNQYLESLDGDTLQSYAKKLLDNSEKEYINKNQLSLFEDTDWAKEDNNDTCVPF